MLKKQQPNVFPLHLAPIDAFYCADDSADYPMTSVIYLDFRGVVQREAFLLALEEALDRHPLLTSLIKPAKQSKPCWVSSGDVKPTIDWGSLDKPITLHATEGFDLSREVGLRLWVRTGEDRSRITLQVHHACTDGTGVYRFLGDLLAYYGIRTGDGSDVPELSEVDPRLLRDRRRRMANQGNVESAAALMKVGLAYAWRVFAKQVRSLSPPREKSEDAITAFPAICSQSFDRDQHKALRAAAGTYGVMLNDLLLAEMFLTILEWNELIDKHPTRGWLRIMMPLDMRDKRDFAMPAGNLTSYTFITRRSQECADFHRLVRDIREETARIKHEGLGTRFIDAVMLAQGAPKVLDFLLSRNRCISSVILSNIGEPSRRFTARLPRQKGKVVCGNMILDSISGVPPMRTKSHATWAIFTYARKMTVSLRCDPFRFSMEHTESLLDIYMKRLSRHIGN